MARQFQPPSGHLLPDDVPRQLVDARIVEAEPAEHGQHHAGDAGLAALITAGVEVDAGVVPEAGIEEDLAGADRLWVTGRQAQAAQEHEGIGGGGPFRNVDSGWRRHRRAASCGLDLTSLQMLAARARNPNMEMWNILWRRIHSGDDTGSLGLEPPEGDRSGG